MLKFEEQRGKLFAIAYRMTGSAMDAEDIVQDAWLRYQQIEKTPDNPEAYLRKMVTNLSLDYLKSARVQREQYVGEWLPEPIATGGKGSLLEEVSTGEKISVAFMVVMETLSPLERAVFLLREVFDYDYAEIARVLDRSESACRKVFSRAKKHVQLNQPRFDTTPEAHSRLVNQFVEVLQAGNVQQMTNLLATDVALYSDGGGKVSAATRPLHGIHNIVAFLAGIHKRAHDMNIQFTMVPTLLNGEQGLVVRNIESDEVIVAATFEVHQDKIVMIRMMRNPDKLRTI